MKAILLCGGSGSRLSPLTKYCNKQFLPVGSVPAIYHGMSTAMLAGIKDILIISTPTDTPIIKERLGNGEQIGINIQYQVQPKPKGIAEAFIIGKDFIGDSNVMLYLGDNFIYGSYLQRILKKAAKLETGARVFCYPVKNPELFGVAKVNTKGFVTDLVEKPMFTMGNLAVIGLYFYDNNVVKKVQDLTPSHRGELEITDLNKMYMKDGNLKAITLGRSFVWGDVGSFKSYTKINNFINTIEEMQNRRINYIEEIAYRQGFITKEELMNLSNLYNNEYGEYLKEVANETN